MSRIPVWSACICGLILLSACTTLPHAIALETPMSQTVQFENAHGALPDKKNQKIITKLQYEVGDLNILQKHLAIEQAINPENQIGRAHV